MNKEFLALLKDKRSPDRGDCATRSPVVGFRLRGHVRSVAGDPFRPVEILIGKALPGFIIGFAEATVILLVATQWFLVPLRGSLGTLYLGLLFFLLSTVGMGLMISSLSVTQQQGPLGAFLFLVPSIILSGFATPIANMPHWVQQLTLLNPMRYFLVVVRGVFLQGTPFHLLTGEFWPMALVGIANLALAGFLFRHRLY